VTDVGLNYTSLASDSPPLSLSSSLFYTQTSLHFIAVMVGILGVLKEIISILSRSHRGNGMEFNVNGTILNRTIVW
jgi:heme/copper-type cytochrome/quinol oxidase subunit 3